MHRFFYHFNKKKGKMSVHFRKTCIVADDIMCSAPCETQWNRTQPKLVMKGWAHRVDIIENVVNGIPKNIAVII